LGQGELKSGGHARSSIQADALEALFAAIYLDCGYSCVRKVILQLFEPRLQNLDLESQQKDPKTRLQEYLQARKIPLPSYQIVEVSGSPHDQQFLVQCVIEELKKQQQGEGSSRRRAEQAAAARLLQDLTADE
jgi:ribonuclease-3